MSLFRSRFVQAVLIVALAFVVLRFGIRPPAPWSVIKIYMTVVFLAVLIYVSADTDSWRSFVGPIRSTLVDPGRRLLRESTPWNSAMPAWEERLTEEQIWQVIMYLYDATRQQPRRWETAH